MVHLWDRQAKARLWRWSKTMEPVPVVKLLQIHEKILKPTHKAWTDAIALLLVKKIGLS